LHAYIFLPPPPSSPSRASSSLLRIFLSSMVRGDLPTPHPSYFSLIDGAWRSPHAPSVVFFPHRWCMAIPPRPIRRIFLPSMLHGKPTAPHPASYFSINSARHPNHAKCNLYFLPH